MGSARVSVKFNNRIEWKCEIAYEIRISETVLRRTTGQIAQHKENGDAVETNIRMNS